MRTAPLRALRNAALTRSKAFQRVRRVAVSARSRASRTEESASAPEVTSAAGRVPSSSCNRIRWKEPASLDHHPHFRALTLLTLFGLYHDAEPGGLSQSTVKCHPGAPGRLGCGTWVEACREQARQPFGATATPAWVLKAAQASPHFRVCWPFPVCRQGTFLVMQCLIFHNAPEAGLSCLPERSQLQGTQHSSGRATLHQSAAKLLRGHRVEGFMPLIWLELSRC